MDSTGGGAAGKGRGMGEARATEREDRGERGVGEVVTKERGGETRLIDVRRERVLAGVLPEWVDEELESELGERGGRGRFA